MVLIVYFGPNLALVMYFQIDNLILKLKIKTGSTYYILKLESYS